MNVLVINCGSSSLKFQLIYSDTEEVLAKGLCERIGIDGQLVYQSKNNKEVVSSQSMPTHTEAIQLVIDSLLDPEMGVVASLNEIHAIGHRVAHGGEKFTSSILITDEVLSDLESCNELAPLHNPVNLVGIHSCRELLPGVPMVIVFDTAFHQSIPEKAFLYGLPYRYYEEYKVRRYGFHGTSHRFVSERAAALLNKRDAKIIVCHLGNGSSICAVRAGESVDTSMGFTPLEGLLMGTRSGDVDPAVLSFIAEKEWLNFAEVMEILNRESGVAGVSGVSSDFRDLEQAANDRNRRAQIALDMFSYRVAKYIGSYAAAMNGVDGIVFTAGIGENAINVRAEICSYLSYLGVDFDEAANQVRGKEQEISAESSKVKLWVIPTNEELAIARETVLSI